MRGNRDRSRARLNPKSARWLISIKPNYYLRLGSVWHVIQKQLFFFLSLFCFVLFFFFAFLRLRRAVLGSLGRAHQIELVNVVRNTNQGKSIGKHMHKSFCNIKAVVEFKRFSLRYILSVELIF